MDTLTPRERRHQKTKQAILQAAQDIITEKGVDALSLRELAQRIDYSPAGLYEYFNSKDDIIAAVRLEAVELFSSYLNRVPTNIPAAERITQLGQAYLDFADNNPEQFMVMFAMGSPQKQSADALHIEHTPYNILQQAVDAYLEAENIVLPAEYTRNDVAYILWAKIHGLAMLRQMGFCQADRDFNAIQRWAFDVFSKGLRD